MGWIQDWIVWIGNSASASVTCLALLTLIFYQFEMLRRSYADLESDVHVLRRLIELRDAENEELKQKLIESHRRLQR